MTHCGDPMHEHLLEGEDPTLEPEPDEFGEQIGDVSGQVLLELLVSLGAYGISQTKGWINFAYDAELFAIGDGSLWGPSREVTSLLSEKIRRAAREREAALAGI